MEDWNAEHVLSFLSEKNLDSVVESCKGIAWFEYLRKFSKTYSCYLSIKTEERLIGSEKFRPKSILAHVFRPNGISVLVEDTE